MSRSEMLAFARGLIAGFRKAIARAVELGVLTPREAETYTWSDMLAENTGIDIEMESELEGLSDAELKQIADAYI